MSFTVRPIAEGFAIDVDDLVVEATCLAYRSNGVGARIVVRREECRLGSDWFMLARAKPRAAFLKKLARKGVELDEAVLEALAEACEHPHVIERPPEQTRPRHPYVMTTQGTYLQLRNGPVLIATFTATITHEVLKHDGQNDPLPFYQIEAGCEGQTFVGMVRADRFASLSWVPSLLGPRAFNTAGHSRRDQVREAIQQCSPAPIPRRTVYTHSGWWLSPTGPLFLFHGGAIGGSGRTEDVATELPGELERLALPDPPSGRELHEAILTSLGILDVTKPATAFGLLGIVYLAPLRVFLEDDPPDFVTFLRGVGGSFKTELTALAMGHFGNFTRLTLPANYECTDNMLERLLFDAKDTVVVVDDLHPPTSRGEQDRRARVAQRLIRGVGNASGRGRMSSELTLRKSFYPRCLVLSSGESVPLGYSTNSRLLVLPVSAGDVDAAVLTHLQAKRADFALAMAGYLRWVAHEWSRLKARVPARFRALRTGIATEVQGHRRDPGQAAHVLLGVEMFLDYAVATGAMLAVDRDERLARARRALVTLLCERAGELRELSPGHRYGALLATVLTSRVAYLEAPEGGPPADGERWGWEAVKIVDRDGVEHTELKHAPGAKCIGWRTPGWLWLLPDAAYQAVVEAAARAHEMFAVGKDDVSAALDQLGWIQVQEEKRADGGLVRRRTVSKRVSWGTPRVLALRDTALLPPSDAPPASDDSNLPESSSVSTVAAVATNGDGRSRSDGEGARD